MNAIRFFNYGLAFKSVLVGTTQKNGLRICCNSKILQNHNSYKEFNRHRGGSNYAVKIMEQEEDNIFKRFMKKIPFMNFEKMKLKAQGYILYEQIADNIDYFTYFEEFNLPDTFYSWFTITELHIWMLSVRAMAEGEDGKVLKNAIIEALWADVAQRVKHLGIGSSSHIKIQVHEMCEQMQAAFIAYDEGIQSDDIVLAGAIWRRFYKMDHVDPHNLDKFVCHIRRQVAILDQKPKDYLFKHHTIRWIPIKKNWKSK